MVGVTRDPPTLIHGPLANATSARAITKFGNIAVTRSRKIHMIEVKKASPAGRKFESQYETIENRYETGTVRSVRDARLRECVQHTEEQ